MTASNAPERPEENTAATARDSAPEKPKRRIAAWFFWGTIGALALGTIGLQIAANRQLASDPVGAQRRAPSTPEQPLPEMIAKFAEVLTKAPSQARAVALEQIEPLLDEAFRPAYDGISAYADFHYSIKGEYTQLVFAAAGTLQTDLDERLFAGLPDRLTDAVAKLDGVFATTYADELRRDVEMAMTSVDLGPAIGAATQNAVKRAGVGVATVGGAASVKLVSKTIAKKLSTKVAAKVAAKGLVKSGSVLSGMGAGAALCSPSGPVAAVCGVIGAGIAWVAVDAVVIGLDELMNREEFEADLRLALDEEKARIARELQGRLAVKESTLLRMVPLQTEDLTLAQLSEGSRLDLCRRAAVLHESFSRIRTEIAVRSPDNLKQFRAHLAQEEDKAGIGKMAGEMRTALDAGTARIAATKVTLAGNFRAEDRVDRKLSVLLTLDAKPLDIIGVAAKKDQGFRAEAPLALTFDPARPLTVTAAIEQHRHLSNTYYGGQVTLSEPMGSLARSQGLTGTISARLPVILDADAPELAEVETALTGANALMNLHIEITAAELDDVPLPDACAGVGVTAGAEG